jgi:hypothetical protein
VKSEDYKKAMHDQYVAGLEVKGWLHRDETIRPTAEQLLEMKKAGIGLKQVKTAALSPASAPVAAGKKERVKHQVVKTGQRHKSGKRVPEGGEEEAPCSAKNVALGRLTVE